MREKIKQTTLQNHGVEYALQSEVIRNKAEASFVENHGTNNMMILKAAYLEQTGYESPFHHRDGQEKAQAGMVRKYGVRSPLMSDAIYSKFKEALLARYGRPNKNQPHISDDKWEILSNKQRFESSISGKTFLAIEREYKLSESTVRSWCVKYDCLHLVDRRGRSKHESDIAAFLDSLNIVSVKNSRSILPSGKELDFYIPGFNIAIELNGVYWHSELSGGKTRNYHRDKADDCDLMDIQLLSIYDSEWELKGNIIRSKILGLLGGGTKGMGARKLTLRPVASEDARLFLEKYHIQGFAHYANSHLGAFYGSDLRAVMSTIVHDSETEIVRFASDAHHSGLFSKMLKTLSGRVTTFADRRLSTGDMYRKAGGKVEYSIPPDYAYTYDHFTLEHKTSHRKEKIARKFQIAVDGKTEWELMRDLGFDRIWDCGKIKFYWDLV